MIKYSPTTDRSSVNKLMVLTVCQTVDVDISVKLQHETKSHVRDINAIELPRPVPRNSVEPDIFFDSADDNVTLTLYNVTLTSQKPGQHNICVIAAKQRYFIEKSLASFF